MQAGAPNPKPAGVAEVPGAALPAAGTAARAPVPVPVPTGTLQITSDKLFAGALEVQIDHHGALYRLKKTSLGKLILTK
jgi:hemin uptake protein HemP